MTMAIEIMGLHQGNSCDKIDTELAARPLGGFIKNFKHVSFDSIEIREFPIELGDNPAVHDGPPIQIGWTPQRIRILEVDVYEIFRRRRRDRQALSISTDERIERLLSEGYTEAEILDAMTHVAKVQHERFESVVCQPPSLSSCTCSS